jgi:predicted TIM-barrel fold metal-dependent hydrolase
MQMNDMILISVDDHIIEPPHLFIDHLPAKYQHAAPRVMVYPNGEERWMFDGRRVPTLAAAAVSGRKREELGAEATRYSQLRTGCYDIHARVADMNANGTLGSMCFPTLPGFAGELFLKGQDKALMQALVQAYNDWHCEEWCGSYPGRFIPLAIVPLWDPALAVQEIERVAKKGAKAVCLPEIPSNFGLPSIHRNYWDPVFKACVDQNLVVAIHIGSSGTFRFPSPDTPLDFANTLVNLAVADAVVDLLFSPILRKFPDLRIAMSEGCVGWLPFLMERADAAYKLHRFWTKQDFGDKMPSDYLRTNFLYCFHHDDIGLKYRHDVGIQNITWECDYPHADSTWPNSPEILWQSLGAIPESEIDMITYQNALRYFNFDPFKHIPKQEATVGALRARAVDVDLTLKSMDGGAKPLLDAETRVLTAASMARVYQEMDAGLIDAEARAL